MDQKTKAAVIGKDMDRMGAPFPVRPGASSKPRPTVREAVPAPDAIDALVNKVMRQMADEKAAEVGSDRAAVERMLLDQVSGK